MLKLGIAYLSNSVGILSEGIHSFLDLISAAVAFFSVRAAGKPADEDHPFGHGKIETLSSLFESILLGLAACFIVYEAVLHILHPVSLHHESLAILVMIISIGMSYLVYRQNSLAAKEVESSAILVNSLHFLSDVVASLGILFGLVLLKLTGWLLIDPIIALLVAGYILVVSAKQVRRALQELSDTQLPHKEILSIKALLKVIAPHVIGVHGLRTRKSGDTRHIDFHLVVCGHMTVEDSHAVCDELESRIFEIFPRASVNIHVEPCEKEKTQCYVTCSAAQKK